MTEEIRKMIIKMLSEAEEAHRSIQNITETVEEFKKNGGKVEFRVYVKDGGYCTTVLSLDSVDKCTDIIVQKYKDMVKQIKRGIVDLLDGIIGEKEEDVYIKPKVKVSNSFEVEDDDEEDEWE